MDVHWQRKKERSAVMSNEFINNAYDVAMANGALGGKVIGAGGGGFLMFYAEGNARLREAMRERKLTEVRFRFEPEGHKDPQSMTARRRDIDLAEIGRLPFSLAALLRDSGRQQTRFRRRC